jgi:hypothetical protein
VAPSTVEPGWPRTQSVDEAAADQAPPGRLALLASVARCPIYLNRSTSFCLPCPDGKGTVKVTAPFRLSGAYCWIRPHHPMVRTAQIRRVFPPRQRGLSAPLWLVISLLAQIPTLVKLCGRLGKQCGRPRGRAPR